MGWWSEDESGVAIVIGDDPLDLALDMMNKITRAYKREVGRKPTPREIEKILELTLSIPVEDFFDGVEVVSVRVEARKDTKPKIKPGDYFAVPLSSGRYGYGRIRGIFLKALIWVEFFDFQSDVLLPIDDLDNAPVLGDFKGGYWALIERRWPIIGNRPVGDVGSVPLRPLAKVPQPFDHSIGRRANPYESDVYPGRTKKEQLAALQYIFPVGYPDERVRQILEWRLAGNEGLPWPEDRA